jgi:hypothetical protein
MSSECSRLIGARLSHTGIAARLSRNAPFAELLNILRLGLFALQLV